jgi:hypothetical protein
LTSKRTAVLVDVVLTRFGTAVLFLVFLVATLAFTFGVFPRTFLGTLILIAVGVPLCLLWGLGFTRGPWALSVRVGAFLGFIALLALVWLWSDSHASFVRQNFF